VPADRSSQISLIVPSGTYCKLFGGWEGEVALGTSVLRLATVQPKFSGEGSPSAD
jgi:hypothetical protein